MQGSCLKHKGYSLLELLLTLALLAIILCISFPSWQPLWQNSTATSQVNKIVTALEYTRIIAIKQKQVIGFCRQNGTIKDVQDWSFGQSIMTSKNNQILRIFSAAPNGDKLIWVGDLNKNNCIEFTPRGIPNGQQGAFYYCHNRSKVQQTLSVVLQETGMIYVKTVSSNEARKVCKAADLAIVLQQ